MDFNNKLSLTIGLYIFWNHSIWKQVWIE